jgi:hypothetical protein
LKNSTFAQLICPTSDFCESLSSPFEKNISLPFFKIMIIVMPSRPGKRGERVVTNVGRDAMDAGCVARRAARTRTAKSCGPGAPGLALSLAGDLRGDGDYEVTDTGESTKISVNTIAQGRPDVSVEPVVNNSCASYTAHEAAGAASARSSLRPLLFEGRGSHKTSDMSCRGNAKLCPGPSLRAQRSTPEPRVRPWIASSWSLSSGRAFARTRWLLAMTLGCLTS